MPRTALLLAAPERLDGQWLFEGFRLTAFTNEEENQNDIGRQGLSWYLASAQNAGAILDDAPARWESLVVVDRNLITGQNPTEATVEHCSRSSISADRPSAPLAVTPDLGLAPVVATSPVRGVAPCSADEDVAVARTDETVGAGTAEEASLLTLAAGAGIEGQPQDVVATLALDYRPACIGRQRVGLAVTAGGDTGTVELHGFPATHGGSLALLPVDDQPSLAEVEGEARRTRDTEAVAAGSGIETGRAVERRARCAHGIGAITELCSGLGCPSPAAPAVRVLPNRAPSASRCPGRRAR